MNITTLENNTAFDYDALFEFLSEPKTASEVQKRFGFKRRNDMMNIITNATFKMLIYEYIEKGILKFALMEKTDGNKRF